MKQAARMLVRWLGGLVKIIKTPRMKNYLQSDSGGPLTYKDGDQHVLIGDVSGGVGCARVSGGRTSSDGMMKEFTCSLASTASTAGSPPCAPGLTPPWAGPPSVPPQGPAAGASVPTGEAWHVRHVCLVTRVHSQDNVSWGEYQVTIPVTGSTAPIAVVLTFDADTTIVRHKDEW